MQILLVPGMGCDYSKQVSHFKNAPFWLSCSRLEVFVEMRDVYLWLQFSFQHKKKAILLLIDKRPAIRSFSLVI